MANYIDGFVLPIPKDHINQYKKVAEKVAEIWKEHGAISYSEYIGEDLKLEGTLPFPKVLDSNKDEVIIFGWVAFKSKEERIIANEKVAADPRMNDLIGPLTTSSKLIFDASRMMYGGFESFI